jgi:hypothetical protein
VGSGLKENAPQLHCQPQIQVRSDKKYDGKKNVILRGQLDRNKYSACIAQHPGCTMVLTRYSKKEDTGIFAARLAP